MTTTMIIMIPLLRTSVERSNAALGRMMSKGDDELVVRVVVCHESGNAPFPFPPPRVALLTIAITIILSIAVVVVVVVTSTR